MLKATTPPTANQAYKQYTEAVKVNLNADGAATVLSFKDWLIEQKKLGNVDPVSGKLKLDRNYSNLAGVNSTLQLNNGDIPQSGLDISNQINLDVKADPKTGFKITLNHVLIGVAVVGVCWYAYTKLKTKTA